MRLCTEIKLPHPRFAYEVRGKILIYGGRLFADGKMAVIVYETRKHDLSERLEKLRQHELSVIATE